MPAIAPYRLNLLRAGYLLVALGMGSIVWPGIIAPAANRGLDRGIVDAMLGAVSLLALIGLRHPLRMLPLLFWEIGWKAIWLAAMALPLWREGRLDAATTATAIECLPVLLIVAVVPWDHIVRTYLAGPGERWRCDPASDQGLYSIRPGS